MKHVMLGIAAMLLITLAHAADPGITATSWQQPVIAGNEVDLNVEVNADGTNGKLWLYEEGQPIQSQDFSSSQSTYLFQRTWNSDGEKSLEFKLQDFDSTGNNSSDDNNAFTLVVLRGHDFTVTSVLIEPPQLLPETNMEITAIVMNSGDTNFSGTLPVMFHYDGVEIEGKQIDGLEAGEVKQVSVNYALPTDFSGTHEIKVTVNKTGVLEEFSLTNNNRTVQISDSTDPNLIVSSISYFGEIYKNVLKNYSVTIQNIGGLQATNVLVHVYRTSVISQNKVYETTIGSVLPYSSQEIDFSFSFPNTGMDKIIAYVDPLNTIPESNNNDNTNETVFEIVEQDVNGTVATTLFFNIYSECVAFISNGDRFLVNSINEDDENGFSVNFDYFSADGKILDSKASAKEGYESGMVGRTMRIASISNGLAKVFLVYQEPVTVQYTSCDVDLSQVIAEKERQRLLRIEAEKNYQTCVIERDASRDSFDNIESERDNCQSNLNI